MKLLTDAHVRERLGPARTVDLMRHLLREAWRGRLLAPARAHAGLGTGAVTVTAGAAGDLYGYRVYDSLPHEGHTADQVVAVHDRATGRLLGLVVGSELGARRTGGLGAVAVDLLARPGRCVLGLIGAGQQAWHQLWAVTAVRPLAEVRVFSRSGERRAEFARRAVRELGVEARPVDRARSAVTGADIVITATTSPRPVLDADWIAPGTHLTTVGPKYADGHELPLALADRATVIATDSPQQAAAYRPDFFLAPTRHFSRLVPLGALLDGAAPGRQHPDDVTLYCSVGLAGTEPLLAAALLADGPPVPGTRDSGPAATAAADRPPAAPTAGRPEAP
ncbi:MULTISPECIES: ornithine cyclodeaminase family protein [Streptomyces]|uniref:Ornithine cyclodeaminase family protein n=1 Tax=Streptomyces ramulosus TaxID=47762 RepID=A0ABW1FEM1_9ACTN